MLGAAQLLWVGVRPWTISNLHLRRRLLPVLACYVAQALVAVAVLGGHSAMLWILAVVVGGLILNAAVTAWTLLREPILVRAQRSAAPPVASRLQASDGDPHQRQPGGDVAPE